MINVRALALTTGIFGALTMFFLAWWLILIGDTQGPQIIFERIYPGFTITPMGSLIGAFWGFIDWGIAGAIFAWIYNWLNCYFKK
ncbi:MAG: hypothetical protein HOI56_04540 [Gammaproteobacteria bacterium]|jgi:hypothetical protein|nr:hypothetical protein [Gammaproteobacteria bacterium]MBT7555181.1 hypothetical protein [Flavobacteriaceae bacterium]MBT5117356.1 hypothetical protein [Gammaproteobacteria bacterium]MBT5761989.1 hypothetical protein [Gammaproteobacteria bacterium]MBT6331792.1 hypothetical protein [Gammaproteobacteria bacterium]